MKTSLISLHSGKGEIKRTWNYTRKTCCVCTNIYMYTQILDMHIYTHRYKQSLHKAPVYSHFFPLRIIKSNNLAWGYDINILCRSSEVNLSNCRTTILCTYCNIYSSQVLWHITQMAAINKKIMDNLGYRIKVHITL